MLLLFIRIVFVILTCFFGHYSVGPYFFDDHQTPHWAGAFIGFAVAIVLVATEHAWRRHFNRTLMAFLLGLSIGLSISFLLIQIISVVMQDESVTRHLATPIALIVTYLVLVSVLRNADRLRLLIPFVELSNDHIETGRLVVDASALADSRFLSLIEAHVFSQRIIVHSSVLIACESAVHGADASQRIVSVKALDGVRILQEQHGERFSIDHTSLPHVDSLNHALIELARLESAHICTNDHAIARMAQSHGLNCTVINDIAQLMLPSIAPGETISVYIEKKGDGDNQGIGHLHDGSMVIVEGAAADVETYVSCTILRLHKTNNGRMVFAESNTTAS